MLTVFADESSDETGARVFAAAGVIGTEDSWQGLGISWAERIGRVPFHAKDCESDRGDYAGNSHSDNQTLYRDLTTLLAQSGLGGWAFAIDLIAQRQVFPDAPEISYYKCFIEVVQAMKNCAAYNRETVQITFDMRKESAHNTSLLYRMLREAPEWADRLAVGISFASSKENTRIQAADLFAREAMKALDNKIGPIKRAPRKSWMALYQTGRFHVEVISKDWFEDLKRQMPAMEATTGMSRKAYLEWLKSNNLQHSTTNLLRHIDSLEKQDQANAGSSQT